MTLLHYAQRVFADYFQIFSKYKDQTRKGKGIEPLHHVRVTSRKLRNALWVFKDIFPAKDAKRWNRNIRALTKIMAAARDLDIQIAFLRNLKRQPKNREHRPAITILQKRLQSRRQKMHPQIVRILDRFEKQKTIAQIKSFFKKNLSTPPARNANLHSLRHKEELYQLAKQRIDKRLKKLFAYAPYVDHPKRSIELHQMRIKAKHLRYTLECFEKFYGESIKPFIEAVRSIQAILGKLHDYDVWIETLPQYHSKNKKQSAWNKSLDHLQEECHKLRDEAYQQFYHLWYSLKDKKIWERLEKILQ